MCSCWLHTCICGFSLMLCGVCVHVCVRVCACVHGNDVIMLMVQILTCWWMHTLLWVITACTQINSGQVNFVSRHSFLLLRAWVQFNRPVHNIDARPCAALRWIMTSKTYGELVVSYMYYSQVLCCMKMHQYRLGYGMHLAYMCTYRTLHLWHPYVQF